MEWPGLVQTTPIELVPVSVRMTSIEMVLEQVFGLMAVLELVSERMIRALLMPGLQCVRGPLDNLQVQ